MPTPWRLKARNQKVAFHLNLTQLVSNLPYPVVYTCGFIKQFTADPAGSALMAQAILFVHMHVNMVHTSGENGSYWFSLSGSCTA